MLLLLFSVRFFVSRSFTTFGGVCFRQNLFAEDFAAGREAHHCSRRKVIFVGGGVKVVEKRRFENPAAVSLERSNF